MKLSIQLLKILNKFSFKKNTKIFLSDFKMQWTAVQNFVMGLGTIIRCINSNNYAI